MSDLSEIIKISCPTCKTIKEIQLPGYLFNQNNFKTVKVQVSEIICPHSFMVFLDPIKRKVIGYEKIDKMLTIPVSEIKDFKDALSLRSIIYLFGSYGTLCLLHARIFNYQVNLFGKEVPDEKLELINNYFNKIKFNYNNRKFEISTINDFYFLKPYVINSLLKDSLILDSNKNILHTPWESPLKFESSILKKAIESKDKSGEREVIQNEVNHFLEEVKFSIAHLDAIEDISVESLLETIREQFLNSIIHSYGLPLLIEYLKKHDKTLLNRILDMN